MIDNLTLQSNLEIVSGTLEKNEWALTGGSP